MDPYQNLSSKVYKNKSVRYTDDLSNKDPIPYDQVSTLLAFTSSGEPNRVVKPDLIISDLDRQKLDMLQIGGDSTIYLNAYGQYTHVPFSTLSGSPGDNAALVQYLNQYAKLVNLSTNLDKGLSIASTVQGYLQFQWQEINPQTGVVTNRVKNIESSDVSFSNLPDGNIEMIVSGLPTPGSDATITIYDVLHGSSQSFILNQQNDQTITLDFTDLGNKQDQLINGSDTQPSGNLEPRIAKINGLSVLGTSAVSITFSNILGNWYDNPGLQQAATALEDTIETVLNQSNYADITDFTYNINTGALHLYRDKGTYGSLTTTIPDATLSNKGLATIALLQQVAQNTADIASLSGLGLVITNLGTDSPTQQQLTDAWNAVKPNPPSEGSEILNQFNDHLWLYGATSTGNQWEDVGNYEYEVATTTDLGLVLSTVDNDSNRGKITVSPTGVMSLIGYDYLLTKGDLTDSIETNDPNKIPTSNLTYWLNENKLTKLTNDVDGEVVLADGNHGVYSSSILITDLQLKLSDDQIHALERAIFNLPGSENTTIDILHNYSLQSVASDHTQALNLIKFRHTPTDAVTISGPSPWTGEDVKVYLWNDQIPGNEVATISDLDYYATPDNIYITYDEHHKLTVKPLSLDDSRVSETADIKVSKLLALASQQSKYLQVGLDGHLIYSPGTGGGGGYISNIQIPEFSNKSQLEFDELKDDVETLYEFDPNGETYDDPDKWFALPEQKRYNYDAIIFLPTWVFDDTRTDFVDIYDDELSDIAERFMAYFVTILKRLPFNIYIPKLRYLNGKCFGDSVVNWDTFYLKLLNGPAKADACNAFNYYLTNLNKGCSYYIFGQEQGAFLAYMCLRFVTPIGTPFATKDLLEKAYLADFALTDDYWVEIPYEPSTSAGDRNTIASWVLADETERAIERLSWKHGNNHTVSPYTGTPYSDSLPAEPALDNNEKAIISFKGGIEAQLVKNWSFSLFHQKSDHDSFTWFFIGLSASDMFTQDWLDFCDSKNIGYWSGVSFSIFIDAIRRRIIDMGLDEEDLSIVPSLSDEEQDDYLMSLEDRKADKFYRDTDTVLVKDFTELQIGDKVKRLEFNEYEFNGSASITFNSGASLVYNSTDKTLKYQVSSTEFYTIINDDGSLNQDDFIASDGAVFHSHLQQLSFKGVTNYQTIASITPAGTVPGDNYHSIEVVTDTVNYRYNLIDVANLFQNYYDKFDLDSILDLVKSIESDYVRWAQYLHASADSLHYQSGSLELFLDAANYFIKDNQLKIDSTTLDFSTEYKTTQAAGLNYNQRITGQSYLITYANDSNVPIYSQNITNSTYHTTYRVPGSFENQYENIVLHDSLERHFLSDTDKVMDWSERVLLNSYLRTWNYDNYTFTRQESPNLIIQEGKVGSDVSYTFLLMGSGETEPGYNYTWPKPATATLNVPYTNLAEGNKVYSVKLKQQNSDYPSSFGMGPAVAMYDQNMAEYYLQYEAGPSTPGLYIVAINSRVSPFVESHLLQSAADGQSYGENFTLLEGLISYNATTLTLTFTNTPTIFEFISTNQGPGPTSGAPFDNFTVYDSGLYGILHTETKQSYETPWFKGLLNDSGLYYNWKDLSKSILFENDKFQLQSNPNSQINYKWYSDEEYFILYNRFTEQNIRRNAWIVRFSDQETTGTTFIQEAGYSGFNYYAYPNNDVARPWWMWQIRGENSPSDVVPGVNFTWKYNRTGNYTPTGYFIADEDSLRYVSSSGLGFLASTEEFRWWFPTAWDSGIGIDINPYTYLLKSGRNGYENYIDAITVSQRRMALSTGDQIYFGWVDGNQHGFIYKYTDLGTLRDLIKLEVYDSGCYWNGLRLLTSYEIPDTEQPSDIAADINTWNLNQEFMGYTRVWQRESYGMRDLIAQQVSVDDGRYSMLLTVFSNDSTTRFYKMNFNTGVLRAQTAGQSFTSRFYHTTLDTTGNILFTHGNLFMESSESQFNPPAFSDNLIFDTEDGTWSSVDMSTYFSRFGLQNREWAAPEVTPRGGVFIYAQGLTTGMIVYYNKEKGDSQTQYTSFGNTGGISIRPCTINYIGGIPYLPDSNRDNAGNSYIAFTGGLSPDGGTDKIAFKLIHEYDERAYNGGNPTSYGIAIASLDTQKMLVGGEPAEGATGWSVNSGIHALTGGTVPVLNTAGETTNYARDIYIYGSFNRPSDVQTSVTFQIDMSQLLTTYTALDILIDGQSHRLPPSGTVSYTASYAQDVVISKAYPITQTKRIHWNFNSIPGFLTLEGNESAGPYTFKVYPGATGTLELTPVDSTDSTFFTYNFTNQSNQWNQPVKIVDEESIEHIVASGGSFTKTVYKGGQWNFTNPSGFTVTAHLSGSNTITGGVFAMIPGTSDSGPFYTQAQDGCTGTANVIFVYDSVTTTGSTPAPAPHPVGDVTYTKEYGVLQVRINIPNTGFIGNSDVSVVGYRTLWPDYTGIRFNEGFAGAIYLQNGVLAFCSCLSKNGICFIYPTTDNIADREVEYTGELLPQFIGSYSVDTRTMIAAFSRDKDETLVATTAPITLGDSTTAVYNLHIDSAIQRIQFSTKSVMDSKRQY